MYRAATIHPTAFVASGAVVLGDVTVGARSSVWFNTVIRGDSAPVVIGEDTNVQDNSVVHEDEGLPAQIGSRVTIGHRAIVHGCVIEDDCLVGMGSVILSGARIGKGSLLGAASLVREGQSVPPGSLVVGSPARILGPVGPRHREAIASGASHYAELARFYALRGMSRAADASGQIASSRPAMTRREWRELVRVLEEGPEWARDRVPDSAAAAALVMAAVEADRDVRSPLVDELARGGEPVVPELRSGSPPQALPWSSALDEWTRTRRTLCGSLAGLGPPAWMSLAGHPTRGPLSLADLVREWVDEDLEARRRLEPGVDAE